MDEQYECPCCTSRGMSVFYEMRDAPVNSVLLLRDRKEALAYPRGNITLGFCEACAFISNVAFDSDLPQYSSGYEESQGFSPAFNRFHRRLATELIERYHLRDKRIIEIGCGKGEFLSLLCELGGNRGLGFDPAYIPGRTHLHKSDQITFIQDFYSQEYVSHKADFICCKMTLEHIHNPADLVRTIRRSMGEQSGTSVFFQVPDVRRILRELAFWDIYYEHCSYFSAESLCRLCRTCGFHVTDLWNDYDDQYLMLAAEPISTNSKQLLGEKNHVETVVRDVAFFSQNVQQKLESWIHTLKEIKKQKQRAVIWGSGSKGVAFLTTLNVQDEIGFAVDINPYKHGTYMPGTGHQIVGPEFAREYRPDIVIVMNPVYKKEIHRQLDEMGCQPELITL